MTISCSQKLLYQLQVHHLQCTYLQGQHNYKFYEKENIIYEAQRQTEETQSQCTIHVLSNDKIFEKETKQNKASTSPNSS